MLGGPSEGPTGRAGPSGARAPVVGRECPPMLGVGVA
uniref:Uncharacterized protein n=1 Tax=Myoviridae sp. ctshb19 TaxID=2825194 RepID=A0A8S5UGG8_9CAUD|nr:MAG TPA: hypothetical protein [Myoviridae sp. ctshb19]